MKRVSKHEKKNEEKKNSRFKKVLDFIGLIPLVLSYAILNLLYYIFFVFLYETIIRNVFLFIKKNFKEICILIITLCIIASMFLIKEFIDELEQYNKDSIQEIYNQIQEQKNDIDSMKDDINNLRSEINEIGSVEESTKQQAKVTSRGGTISRSQSYEWKEFNVSAYCSCSKCCGKSNGITASGAKAVQGTTIAAPSSYPFGTKIYLEGLGTYTVQDRGGAIQGNKLDIYFSSHSEALAFGRKNIKGRIVQ